MKKISCQAAALRRLVLFLCVSSFCLLPSAFLEAAGLTACKNCDVNGTSQIRGTTNLVSGAALHLEAGTVSVGTFITISNGNMVFDPNGTGAIELLANTYIGSAVTTPTALLQLKAGTATAGTGPFKLTSGTLLTTAEAGLFEYDGSFFYVTSSAPTRQRISTDAATSAISASAIDWSLSGTFSKTLAANTTFTFSNATDGRTIVVALTNTTGNYTVTWPTVSWTGGTAPVQTIGAKTDVYTLIKIGSTTYGSVIPNF
jgi:hypothetical protein